MQFIIALFTGDIGVYAVFKFHYKSMLHLFIPCTPGLSSPPFNYLLLRKLPIYNLACIVQLNVLVNDLNPDLMFRVRFCQNQLHVSRWKLWWPMHGPLWRVVQCGHDCVNLQPSLAVFIIQGPGDLSHDLHVTCHNLCSLFSQYGPKS